jgi:hypothetical protein
MIRPLARTGVLDKEQKETAPARRSDRFAIGAVRCDQSSQSSACAAHYAQSLREMRHNTREELATMAVLQARMFASNGRASHVSAGGRHATGTSRELVTTRSCMLHSLRSCGCTNRTMRGRVCAVLSDDSAPAGSESSTAGGVLTTASIALKGRYRECEASVRGRLALHGRYFARLWPHRRRSVGNETKRLRGRGGRSRSMPRSVRLWAVPSTRSAMSLPWSLRRDGLGGGGAGGRRHVKNACKRGEEKRVEDVVEGSIGARLLLAWRGATAAILLERERRPAGAISLQVGSGQTFASLLVARRRGGLT